jgi:hypothetical protein
MEEVAVVMREAEAAAMKHVARVDAAAVKPTAVIPTAAPTATAVKTAAAESVEAATTAVEATTAAVEATATTAVETATAMATATTAAGLRHQTFRDVLRRARRSRRDHDIAWAGLPGPAASISAAAAARLKPRTRRATGFAILIMRETSLNAGEGSRAAMQ